MTNPSHAPAHSDRELRTIAITACVLLVTLRLFIGWQLLYEGLWKVQTLGTARPWTGAGFLGAAQGPFREMFRGMSGDPDGFAWLDYDDVAGKWDAWRGRFESYYGPLTDEQRAKLDRMIDGPDEIVQPLPSGLPEGMKSFPPRGIEKGAVRYDAARKAIIVDGEQRLTPAECERLLRADPAWRAWRESEAHTEFAGSEYSKAVTRLSDLVSRLSYKQRLRATLLGDPDRNGYVLPDEDDPKVVAEVKTGQVEVYRYRLDEYEKKLAEADQAYEFDHLGKQWAEIQSVKSELIGPVKALGAAMVNEAQAVLTADQKARGREPNAWNAVRVSDTLVITGLTTLGTLLLLGCWTRLAAIGAGVMILSFYLVWPPWPGVPSPPGVEHSLVVNKNLIEVAALFAIAAMPTGSWFGVDGALRRIWRSFRSRPAAATEETSAAPARTTPANEPVAESEDEPQPVGV